MALAHFKALNVDSSEESDGDVENPTVTREALEEKAVAEYTKVLLLQKNKQWKEAEDGLKKLLESDVLCRVTGTVNYIAGRLQPSLVHLKYCVLLNLGHVLTEMNDIKTAVNYYLEAITLDDTDLNLWYRIGRAAIQIPNLNLASYAFQEALRCNPSHWPSLDTLITVLYASGNFLSCLYYIHEGLEKDCKFTKAAAFCQKIFTEHPSFKSDFPLFYPQCSLDEKLEECGAVNLEDPVYFKMFEEADSLKKNFETLQWPTEIKDEIFTEIKPDKPLHKKSWMSLGLTLLQVYCRLTKEYPEIEFFRPVNLSNENETTTDQSEPDNDEKDYLDERLLDEEVDNINETAAEIEDAGIGRSKRRRSSPSLLEQWITCSKRRSARVRSTVRKEEPTLARALHNLLPQALRPSKEDRNPVRWNDESMDTMDLYRLFENKDGAPTNESNENVELMNNVSDEELNRFIVQEKYFNEESEITDIKKFIEENNRLNVLIMISNYLRQLSTKWNLWWPGRLKAVYLKMYKIFRQHFPENCQNSDPLDFSAARALLMYGELLLDCWLQKGKLQGLPSPVTGTVFGGEFCTLSFGDLNYVCDDSDDAQFIIRCFRLEALMYLYDNSLQSTVVVLERYMNDERCDNQIVKLCNVKHHHFIDGDLIERLLNTLNRNERLSNVQKLFSDKKFENVIEILMEALQPTAKLLTAEFVEPVLDRCSQFSLLLDSLFELERYEDAFIWCELCCHEALVRCRASFEDPDGNKSKWSVLLTNALQALPYCLDHGGLDNIDKLSDGKLIRLIQTLSSVVCHQIESLDSASIPFETVSPWILLYEIIKNYETHNKTFEDDEIPNSLTLLFTAHEYLGKRSWCCVDEGDILFKTLVVLLPIMETSNPECDKMIILNHQMEQIFYCLYGHPIKRNRPRYVQEHNTMGLALTWSRSHLVYRFLKPRELPMYDSSARYSISQDVEVLFRRIVDLIPNEYNPSKSIDKVNNYIEGVSNELPIKKTNLPEEIGDVYYLIADYYFKNKMWRKAISHYVLDVCANPNRVDSWACLALARGSMLETKLNSCKHIKNEDEFLKRAKMSCRCYQRSLQLDPEQSTLWIEYGSFSYMIHSFCSRLLSQEQNLSLELFEILETQKESMLETASKCFTSANMLWNRYEQLSRESEIQDERWLHHYMLGKISEKREEKPIVYLNHFMKSIKFLHHNNAKYPQHISYSGPQLYSVEALELYYRVHASILKMLEQSENKPIDIGLRQLFFEVLERAACSPFANFGEMIECNYNNENLEESIKGKPLVETEVRCVMDNILLKICDDTHESTSKRKVDDCGFTENESSAEQPSKRRKSHELETSDKGILSDSSESKSSKSLIKQRSKDSDTCNDSKNDTSDENNDERSEDCKKVEKKRKSQESSSETLSDSDTSSSDSNSSEDSSTSESDSSSSESTHRDSSDNDKPPPSKKMKILDTGLGNWKEEQTCLIARCLCSMEQCVRRFPEHYKSLYRQAQYYFRSETRKDNAKVRKLLLGEGGLFADRKPTHFFNGVWRIPSSEIDRPGSFAGHMSRCLHLLLELLRDMRDDKMLLSLAFQLKDTPEPDKKYLRDNEREQLAKESVTLSVQAYRSKLHEKHDLTNVEALLNDVYRCYRRINKYWPQRDSEFATLLTQCFSKYIKLKGGKWKCNLDTAVKFCLDGILVPLPVKIEKPKPIENPVSTPPSLLLKPTVLQPQEIVSQINKPLTPPIITTAPTVLQPTSIVTNPKAISGTSTVRLPKVTQKQLSAPIKPKRPRGRPAGSSIRHPNPVSQMMKKMPNMTKDIQALYKNLSYSPQQMLNLMRANPMLAMQASISSMQAQQQFNSIQAELMRQLNINQSAQKSSLPQPPSMSANTSVITTSPSTVTSVIKSNSVTVTTSPMSLITSPKDHPNITITPVPTTPKPTSVPNLQLKPTSLSTSNQAHHRTLKSPQNVVPKSNIKLPPSTIVKPVSKQPDLQSIQISPKPPKSPIVHSPTSVLKSPVSPYNPIPSPKAPVMCHPMPPMPIPSSDMSLQHKLLSAKRSKQPKDISMAFAKEPNDKLLSNLHMSKSMIDMSKGGNDGKFLSPGPTVNPALYISKLQQAKMSEKQKELALSTANSDLTNKFSGLSPKDITLTRLPQTVKEPVNKSSDKLIVSYADSPYNRPKQLSQPMQSRQPSVHDLSQLQQHVSPSVLMSNYKNTSDVVDNRISALKAIGTHLTITQAGLSPSTMIDNSNSSIKMKSDTLTRYDKADVTIGPAAKERQKKDQSDIIFLE